MKSKTCAYCKREFSGEVKRTAEHIFPQTLLQLYPEQDVSFTPEKIFKDNSGLTIADVCAGCNNGALSELDSYGGELIKKQFKDEIDYNMKDAVIEKTIADQFLMMNSSIIISSLWIAKRNILHMEGAQLIVRMHQIMHLILLFLISLLTLHFL